MDLERRIKANHALWNQCGRNQYDFIRQISFSQQLMKEELDNCRQILYDIVAERRAESKKG